ncbi:MAG: N-acetylneuraminate synthase [Gammaproteobacteria bacterium]|nr:N-acetylneuraminate synthase [Gammaproteobacteria bacterium]
MKKTLIIAEAGVNHNGDEKLAFELVDAACAAGADIVKFQTFKAGRLVSKHAKQADYQAVNTGVVESQYDMLRRLELSYDMHYKLIAYCHDKGIEFLSTAFDLESLSFLVDSLGLKRLKLPSGEITNAPLVLAHARSGCDIIVSTGMASLSDIEQTLGIIAFGLIDKTNQKPTKSAFRQAFFSSEGQQALREKVTLLHCTTEYPAPPCDINLKAMDTMAQAFPCAIGYSDHSEGITVPVAAVSRGACLLEKHFTIDRNLPGPDHLASLEPDELKAMVDSIRMVEQVLGDGIKGPRPSEQKNVDIARKSLVVAAPIKRGECFNEQNLTVKRPGNGVSPMDYWEFIGTVAEKDYEVDEVVL